MTSSIRQFALLILAALAGACHVTAPKVWVRGLVIDPDSLRPLAGVTVSGREGSTTTNAEGRYELQVPAGVRELTFQASDRPAARKFVVIDRAADQRLDTLLPTSPPDTPALAVYRLWVFGNDVRDSAEVEAGASSALSLHDRHGNNDRFLRWENDGLPGLASPRFSADGRFLYVGLAVGGLESKARAKEGVYRYDLQSNQMSMLPRVDRFGVRSLALSPDGSTVLACTSEAKRAGETVNLLAIRDIDRPGMRAAEIPSPVAGDLREVLFDRSGAVYLVHWASSSLQQSVRLTWPDLQVDRRWTDSGAGDLTSLVALEDGSVLGKGKDGVYRRKPDGTLDKLVGEPLEVVGFDATGGVLYYRAVGPDHPDHLHWRHLASGLDLRIVSSAQRGAGVRF